MRPIARLSLLLLAAVSAAVAQQPQKASERQSVDLTVYNMNLALVREERSIDLAKGMNRVVIPDIPATIDGTSLHFASLTDPLAVHVLEQNYQYDLLHQAKLLEKYIGREVQFVRLDESTKKEYTVNGTLLATGWQFNPSAGTYGGVPYMNTGAMIAEINGRIEIAPAGRLVLPALPDGLILRPQLAWLVSCSRPGTHRTEISYLAREMTWSCNYVALLNAADTKLDLTGWVTLVNRSGTSFKDAGLKLVAGDVNLVQEQGPQAYNVLALRAKAADEAQQFAQKELFEYKLYSLQRRTDIADNETKQLELTSASGVAAKKVFIYDGMADQWRSWMNNASYRNQGSFGQQSNTKVGVFVTFRNEEKSGLGIPLPKGKVRVYKKDDDGKEQFIGEDMIDHTPKDEEVRLYLGNAFDIVGERAQKDFRVVASGHVVEETIEIKVRNHKSEEVEVQVYEHPWRWNQWDIVKTNGTWEKVDQSTIRFPVRLKPSEERLISYTIRYTW